MEMFEKRLKVLESEAQVTKLKNCDVWLFTSWSLVSMYNFCKLMFYSLLGFDWITRTSWEEHCQLFYFASVS